MMDEHHVCFALGGLFKEFEACRYRGNYLVNMVAAVHL